MHPLHVLGVEDWRDSADLLGMLLRLWGHEVEVAYKGADALAAAEAAPPDVVLLDVGLPDTPG